MLYYKNFTNLIRNFKMIHSRQKQTVYIPTIPTFRLSNRAQPCQLC